MISAGECTKKDHTKFRMRRNIKLSGDDRISDRHHTIFYEVIMAKNIAKIKEDHFVFTYSHTVASKSHRRCRDFETSDDIMSSLRTPGYCACRHRGRFKASDIMPTPMPA
jgi:hypothetical protein